MKAIKLETDGPNDSLLRAQTYVNHVIHMVEAHGEEMAEEDFMALLDHMQALTETCMDMMNAMKRLGLKKVQKELKYAIHHR